MCGMIIIMKGSANKVPPHISPSPSGGRVVWHRPTPIHAAKKFRLSVSTTTSGGDPSSWTKSFFAASRALSRFMAAFADFVSSALSALLRVKTKGTRGELNPHGTVHCTYQCDLQPWVGRG